MPDVAMPQDKLAFLADASTQRGRVFIVMRDASAWLQLHEIAAGIRERFNVIDSEAAISARLRDLRNLYGQTVMHHRRPGSNADEYRLMVSTNWDDAPSGEPVAAGQGSLPLEVAE